MLPWKAYDWHGGQDDKIPIWLDGERFGPMLYLRNEFEWSVEADDAISLRLSDLCFFIFHKYALVDLKSSDPRAHGGIAIVSSALRCYLCGPTQLSVKLFLRNRSALYTG